MKPLTRSLLTAGPLAILGVGFLVLAGLVLPFVGVIFLLALFESASNPQSTASPFIGILPLLSVPVQMAYLGCVMIALANRKITAGARVSNLPMVVLSIAVAALTVGAILAFPQIAIKVVPVGIAIPLAVLVLRFTETPSKADTI